jgi:hypothetical protein
LIGPNESASISEEIIVHECTAVVLVDEQLEIVREMQIFMLQLDPAVARSPQICSFGHFNHDFHSDGTKALAIFSICSATPSKYQHCSLLRSKTA